MSENEVLEENKRLKERVAELETLLQNKNTNNARAYNEIRLMIANKVKNEVEADIIQGVSHNWTRKRAEKKIMSDLKWDLRVRIVADFREDHINQAKEYLNNYVIPDEYRFSRWNKEA